MHAVERWFGEAFDTLHPHLRALHRAGGVLEGSVELVYGDGIAGRIGRRLARRMGLPGHAGTAHLRVDIHGDTDALHWQRTFDGTHAMHSRFVPVGTWPHGHWLETTGPLRLALTVDTRAGAWRWLPRAAWLHDVRVPLALLPRVSAGKRVDEDGAYVFDVTTSLPGLGVLFGYRGRLTLNTAG